MQQHQCDWAQIEVAFRAGKSLAEIRECFCVSLADLLKHAKAAGWKHGEARATRPDRDADHDDPHRLPVLVTAATTKVIDEVVDALVTDIAASHKDITRKLRQRFESELAEFDALAASLASFTDHAHIADLATKADGGKELRAYLVQCLASHEKRTNVLERLGRIGAQIINLERMVWSLDNKPTATETTDWVAILEQIRKPLAPLALPDNVIEFERKITIKDRQAE